MQVRSPEGVRGAAETSTHTDTASTPPAETRDPAAVRLKGPTFSEVGTVENLILFSQGALPGWEGKTFGHCNDSSWRGTKCKLLAILAHYEGLTTAEKKKFKGDFHGGEHFNFTKAYKSITG